MIFERVIVFEPNHTGHRMQYASWLRHWAEDAGISFSLATASETLTSPEFHERFGPGDVPRTIDLGVRASRSRWRYQLWVLARLRKTLRANPDAAVLLTEGDHFIGLVWLLGRLRQRLGVLVMRVPRPSGSILSRTKRTLVQAAARSGRVRVLAPAMPVASAYVWRGLAATPDPVELSIDRDLMGSMLPEVTHGRERRWVGVFGALSERKNVAEVVRAAATASSGRTEVGVILAGKVAAGYGARLGEAIEAAQARGCTVLLIDRFLTNAELDTAIAAADVAVVAYSNDAPSGIFGKAAAAGTVVIAAGAPTLAEAVAPLGRRAIYAELTPDSLASAIASAIEVAATSVREPLTLAGPAEFADALFRTLN